MADMKSAARTAMAAKLISDVVTAEHKPVKVSLLADMVDGGVERVRVTDDDGNNLGAVSVTSGRVSAKVFDEQAFTAWVAERHPHQLVEVVREAFAKKVLAEAVSAGDPVDPTTGEQIPGVELVAGDPYLMVRPAAGAVDKMRETLIERGLLQLPGGPS
jgi:hypothetical protein